MLDKSPNDGAADVFSGSVNSILCQDAFAKEAAVGRIVRDSSGPVVLIDFDRLFTGYINSHMLPTKDGLQVYAPTRQSWRGIFREIAVRVSTRRTVLIVDSLNGFFSIFDEKDSGRQGNSYMMMLSSCIRAAGGKIFLCSVSRVKENGEWILQPTGRHVLDTGLISKFFVRRQDGIRVESLSRKNRTENVFHL